MPLPFSTYAYASSYLSNTPSNTRTESRYATAQPHRSTVLDAHMVHEFHGAQTNLDASHEYPFQTCGRKPPALVSLKDRPLA